MDVPGREKCPVHPAKGAKLGVGALLRLSERKQCLSLSSDLLEKIRKAGKRSNARSQLCKQCFACVPVHVPSWVVTDSQYAWGNPHESESCSCRRCRWLSRRQPGQVGGCVLLDRARVNPPPTSLPRSVTLFLRSSFVLCQAIDYREGTEPGKTRFQICFRPQSRGR